VCCSVLQCVAVQLLRDWALAAEAGASYTYTCQCVAACCSLLQCAVVCCSVVQNVAVHGAKGLGVSGRYVLVRCSVL